MKIIRNFVLALSLLIPNFFYASMPAYHNTIKNIQEISGVTTYTLILSCDQQQPIAINDPQTYQQSIDSGLVTITMPNTTLADGIEVNPEIFEVTDAGSIQLHLEGRLTQKIVGAYKIFITMEKLG